MSRAALVRPGGRLRAHPNAEAHVTQAEVTRLRIRLARALRQLRPDTGEALHQLQVALSEPASPACQSDIYLEMGHTLRARRETPAAFSAYMRAVTVAPAASKNAAETALTLLEGEDVASFALNLPQTALDELAAAVVSSSGEPPASVCVLVARLKRLRGDAAGAIEVLRVLAERTDPNRDPTLYTELARALVDGGHPSDGLHYLSAIPTRQLTAELLVLRAWAQLDLGEFDAALGSAAGLATSDSGASTVRGLALFGLGRLDEALAVLSRAPADRDACLAQAVVRLHRASLAGMDVQPDRVAEANEAAIAAARHDPANPHVLLIRAQVYLEGCLDVDEGRRLLSVALHHKQDIIERSRWLLLQECARAGSAWFQYFQVELKAAREDYAAVIAGAARVNRSRTAFAHDGALETLLGQAYAAGAEPLLAAAAFAAASAAFENAGDFARAAVVGRQRLACDRTPSGVVGLADDLWQGTYQEGLTSTQILSAIEEGLTLLQSYGPEITPDLIARAVVLRGLLLYRRAELATSGIDALGLQAAPWLVTATLLEPRNAVWSAHAAWAFDHASAQRTALYFAERALTLARTDTYAQETALTMRLNYFGTLDDQTRELAQSFAGPADWLASVLVFDKLLRNDLRDLDRIDPNSLFDAVWARTALACARVLVGQADAARDLLRSIVDEAQQVPSELGTAARAALLLGDFDRAQALLASARRAREIPQPEIDYACACLDLVRSGAPQAEQRIAAYLQSAALPRDVRSAATMELPLLQLARGAHPATAASAERLVAAAWARLAEMDELPPLGSDLRGASSEARQLVSMLLELVELAEADDWARVGARAGELASRQPDALLGHAFQRLESQALARAAKRSASPAGSQAGQPG